MNITLIVKNVYGNDLIYPDCEKSKIFCNLAKKKTLNLLDIKNIKALGYEVKVNGHLPQIYQTS